VWTNSTQGYKVKLPICIEVSVRIHPALKRVILAAFHKTVQFNVAVQNLNYRYVFILAHFRSGSTLLSHILTSHPDFVGAGETHTTYRTAADLPKLIPRTCELLRSLQLRSPYILDKITMDQYLIDKQILLSPLIYRCVILVRAPQPSLKSIIDLFNWEERMALDHYVTRLETLAQYGELLRERAFFLEYDQLVERSAETLAALTRFFGVSPPFNDRYAKHKATGKMGDPSRNILRGHIFRTTSHERIQISTEVMNEASLAFRGCQQRLLKAGLWSAVPSFG
jgi:hypothetical protein